jgi:DNA-binding NarL/FixJ family response regulator
MRAISLRRYSCGCHARKVHAMDTARTSSVFLVDDSAAVRERLKELLALDPAVRIVGEAESATAAIRGIAATRPDFAVLDYRLAGGTGLDVLCALADQARGTVFIVLTNHADTRVRAACTRAGASFFLDKSREFGRLRSIIAGADAVRA